MNIFRTIPLFVFFGLTFLNSCKKEKANQPELSKQELFQKIADSIYQSYSEEWGIDEAGLHFYISGASGTYMVSSNISPKPLPESHFRIASITKTFTAAAIMLLHQQGALNIHDSIDDYLPNTAEYDIPFKNQITIKQLLQHRSGVFDVSNEEIPASAAAPYAGMKYEDYMRSINDFHTFTFDELIGINAEHQLNTAIPGENFHYSNTGYNILGKIIEEVSGLSFSDFISQKFTIPLGLNDTYSPWEGNDVEMPAPYINSYLYIVGDQTIETSKDNVTIHVSEGNMVSTPKDITKWIKLLLTGNAGISPSNVALMKEMQPADTEHGVYGLGLGFDEMGFGHNGIHKSYVTSTRYNPENGISATISANFIRFDPATGDESIYELAYAILDAMKLLIEEYKK